MIVAKLDRLSRDVGFIHELIGSSVEILFADLPAVSGAIGKFLLMTMANVAELEAGLISERTKAALKAARARGVKLGRHGAEILAPRYRAEAHQRAVHLKPIITALKDKGHSLSRIAAELNDREVETPRGGRWDHSSVRNVLRRLEGHAGRMFGRDVRRALLEAGTPMGCLRLLSERKGLGLRFDGLNYGACVDRNLLQTEVSALVREVLNRTNRQDMSVDYLVDGARGIEEEAIDPWQICAGPDLMGVLSLGLRHALGTNDGGVVRDPVLRQALRLAYGNEEFMTSRLRRQFLQWEERNPFRILP